MVLLVVWRQELGLLPQLVLNSKQINQKEDSYPLFDLSEKWYNKNMKKKQTKGQIRLDIVLAVFILLIIIGSFFWFNQVEKIKARDAIRLADMHSLEQALVSVYKIYHSYEAVAFGCQEPGSPVSNCDLADWLPEISAIQDPGQFAYLVEQVPGEQTFSFKFQLEGKYGQLSPGEHFLTANGIN